MGREYPPQRFCDKCKQPDYEYPYTSYTGQVDQVTPVFFGETMVPDIWNGNGCFSPPEHKIGVDLGYLYVKCRYELYHKVLRFIESEGYTAKRLDESIKEYVTKDGKSVKGWWDIEEFEIKGLHNDKAIEKVRIEK